MHASEERLKARFTTNKCDLCGKSFGTIKRLKRHRKICKKLGAAKPVFKCQYCDANFSAKHNVVVHIKSEACKVLKKLKLEKLKEE